MSIILKTKKITLNLIRVIEDCFSLMIRMEDNILIYYLYLLFPL